MVTQNFTTNAINLKTYPLSETDKIVLMYSQDKGLIRGVAKGAKKAKSKLGGRMDILVANKLLLHKGKNLDTIAQAEAMNSFYKIRLDMDKMMYSMYCAEMVMNLGVENDPSANEIFELLYNCLQKIADSKNKIETLLATLRFQLKMTETSGYALELQNCTVCGTPPCGELFFSLAAGGVVCEKCSKNFPASKRMNIKLRDFLQTLAQTDFSDKTEYDHKADEKICLFCFNLLKEHILQFSPKKFKTLSTLQEFACV